MNQAKTIVITGATSGFALETAKLFTKDGFNLALIGRTESSLKSAEQILLPFLTTNTVTCYKGDVSKSNDMAVVFQAIIKKYKHIDALATIAGMSHGKPIHDDSEKYFEEELAINLKGTYLCIMAAYQFMPAGSSIVTIASSRARTGTATSAIGYAAAKAGVINMTKSFALQLAKRGIRVNCVSPYYVHPTPFTAKYTKRKLHVIEQGVPLGRLATYDDVAQAIYFLLSDKANYITGHTLDVDGGIWMN